MPKINTRALNKGELRKLTALRKSLGQDIADKAFADWLKGRVTETKTPVDKDAKQILDALEPLVLSGKIKLPRGGYVVRRGRGRVIVERGRAG